MNNAASIYDYMGQRNRNSMFINPVFFFRVLHTLFDLCEGGSRIADLESGRARDVHASTVSPINPVNEAEVTRTIKLCKPKDAMGYDDISMWVLLRIAPKVVKPLVHIFNLSFSTGIFPSEMIIAKLIPLFINGKKKSDFSKQYVVVDNQASSMQF